MSAEEQGTVIGAGGCFRAVAWCVVVALLGGFTSSKASAADAAPSDAMALANPTARKAQDLGGAWHYIIDKQRLGIRDPIDRFSFGRDEPDHNHPLTEYSWD